MNHAQKFYGSADQLIAIIALTGIPGEWEQLLYGHYRFRSHDGAVFNWWSSTNTIFLQGSADAVRELEEALLRSYDSYSDSVADAGLSKGSSFLRLEN